MCFHVVPSFSTYCMDYSVWGRGWLLSGPQSQLVDLVMSKHRLFVFAQVAVAPTFTDPRPQEPQAATGVAHSPFPSPPLGNMKMKASLMPGSSPVKGQVHFPLLKQEWVNLLLPMSTSEACVFSRLVWCCSKTRPSPEGTMLRGHGRQPGPGL